MAERRDDRAEGVEAYLDGLLDGEARERFERRLAEDATLRAEIELQGRIEASLRRTFGRDGCSAAPVGAASLGGAVAKAESGGGAGMRLRRWWPAGLAAALAVAAGLVWLTMFAGPGGGGGATGERMMLVEMYELQDETGWTPDWVCDTDEQFAKFSEEILGRVVLAAPGRAGVAVTGWKYGRRVFGQRTAQLLARVDDANAMVLIGYRSADRALELPPGSGLRLFRRELDDLVLYEVTPKDAPEVIGLFFSPDRAPAPDSPEASES